MDNAEWFIDEKVVGFAVDDLPLGMSKEEIIFQTFEEAKVFVKSRLLIKIRDLHTTLEELEEIDYMGRDFGIHPIMMRYGIHPIMMRYATQEQK